MTKIRRVTPTEHQIQAAYIDIVESNTARYPDLKYLRAFPNGGIRPWTVNAKGKRYSVAGQRLAAEGVKKGPLDIILPLRRGAYTGLWFEFKRPREKMTPEQLDYAQYLLTQGWYVDTQFDALAAWKMTLMYLNLNPVEAAYHLP